MLKRARPDVSGQVYLESDTLQLKRTKIIPIPTNNLVTLTLPSTTGTLALTTQIPSTANLVDLTSTQTISGVKTFTSAPVVSSLTNGAASVTVPTTSGTLALSSQIPTNGTYVDLTTTQLVSGLKTFSNGLNSNGVYINTGNLTIANGTLYGQTINMVGTSTPAIPSLYFIVDTSSGWYRPLSNQWGWSASGTNVMTLSSAGISLNGKVTTNQLQVGSNGSTTTTLVRGTISYGTALAANTAVGVPAVNYTGNVTFASIPNIICSLQDVSGSGQWDQCSCAAFQTSTTTLSIAIRNGTGSATSGNVQINYIAWV